VLQDVDGRQLREVHGLEVGPQVFGPRDRRFPTNDEDLVPSPDVDVGHGLADEPRPARDDDVHVIKGVGRMKKAGVTSPGLMVVRKPNSSSS
jgi:hypothetical protein